MNCSLDLWLIPGKACSWMKKIRGSLLTSTFSTTNKTLNIQVLSKFLRLNSNSWKLIGTMERSMQNWEKAWRTQSIIALSLTKFSKKSMQTCSQSSIPELGSLSAKQHSHTLTGEFQSIFTMSHYSTFQMFMRISVWKLLFVYSHIPKLFFIRCWIKIRISKSYSSCLMLRST